MLEVLPLVDAGVLGSSERFRLEREEASIETQLQVLSEKVAQTELEIEQAGSQITMQFKSIIIPKSIKNVLKSQVKLQS